MEEHCTHDDEIKEIKADALTTKAKLQEIEVRQVEIQGDVRHIKGRIDNGMSLTITNLDRTLIKLTPIIEHHSDIIRRIEGIGWTLATSLIVALIAYLAWGIAHGFQLPT